MTKEELIQLWQDPQHWRGGLYRCAADPRVIVPTSIPTGGWTVNFAHRQQAVWAILLSIVVAVGPVMLLVLTGIHNLRWIWAAMTFSLTALIMGSYYLSGRTHPEALPGIVIGVTLILVPSWFLCRAGVKGMLWYVVVIVAALGIVWLMGLGMRRPR
jgi:hypothetical protein